MFRGLGLVDDGVRAVTGHGGAPVWLKNTLKSLPN